MTSHSSGTTVAMLSTLAFAAASSAAHAADGPPLLELHLWGGTEAADSESVGLRSAELASWVTRRDRIAVAYDNSLSLDNPALARAGINADSWTFGYQHDFSGNYLVSAGAGSRDLSNGATQDIYKLELVRLRDNRVVKIGAQINPTDSPSGSYTDGVVYGALNLPIAAQWRFEPAVFLGRSGVERDQEWRFAGYTEFNAHNGTQLGFGLSAGMIRSNLAGASGGVFAAHARLSWPLLADHLVHLQVRHESSPVSNYTIGMLGVSLRFARP